MNFDKIFGVAAAIVETGAVIARLLVIRRLHRGATLINWRAGIGRGRRRRLIAGLPMAAGLIAPETAERAIHTAVGAIDGLAAHGHDLRAWLCGNGMDLSWR